jgi:hypothetical protein
VIGDRVRRRAIARPPLADASVHIHLDTYAPRGGGPIRAITKAPDTGAYTGAWVLSSQNIDASGHPVDTIPLSRTGACGPPQGGPAQQSAGAKPGDGLSACFAEMKRLGYRQQLTYQPSNRYWTFQAYETAIFLSLALVLIGFCFWWLRDHL